LGALWLIIAVSFSVLFAVPYFCTAIGIAVWVFVGHLITIDDDFSGGWSNPDGIHPFPWHELGMKALILISLVLIATIPGVRQLGG
jgi:hypothetical protein